MHYPYRFLAVLFAITGLTPQIMAADAASSAQSGIFHDMFAAGSTDAAWKIQKSSKPFGDIQRSTDPQTPGFAVSAPGDPSAIAQWDAGVAPFDFWFDVNMTVGTVAPWRYNGIVVGISSAPIGEMTGTDVVFATGFHQAGVRSSMERGPFYKPNGDKKTPRFQQEEVSKRFDLNMGGAGGESFSIAWPKKQLNGMRLRCRIQRLADNKMHFEVYNADGDWSKPWWIGDVPIPADLADVPIRYVSVFTTEETPDQTSGVPFGNTVVAGRISMMEGWTAGTDRPSITGYAAESGGVLNGKTIVIKGANFSQGATVFINGAACQTQSASPTELRAVAAGVGSQGVSRLQVANPNGLFGSYDPGICGGLCLTAIEPREDLPAGGSIVTVHGGGFDATTKVSFNGTPALVVGAPSTDAVQVKVPPGQAGPASVTASNGGQSFTGSLTFGYAPHPYMLFKGAPGLAAVKARFDDPGFAPYRKAILVETDKAIAGLDKIALGAHGQINEAAFGSAFAYAMTGDPKYKDAAMRTYKIQFEGGAGAFPQKQWDYPGSLCQALDKDEFLVMTGEAFAIMYDTMFDQLTPEMRAKMEHYLDDYALYYKGRVAAGDWWYGGGANPSNTIPVGSGGSGIIALALRYSTPEYDAILGTAAKNITKYYKAMQDDGGCTEGDMYWNYGLGAQMLYGLVLDNATGNDKGLLSDPKFPKMVDFVAALVGGDGNMFVFNDTQPWINGVIPEALAESHFDQPLMRWACDEIARRVATGSQAPEVGRPTYIIPAFLLRDAKPMLATPPPLPTLTAMKVLNWGALRSSPNAVGTGLVVGVKGVGGTQTHHAEEDAGSFVVQSRGESFIIHPGYFQGTAPEHNLPIIGEFKTDAPYGSILNPDTTAPLGDMWESGSIHTMSVDATASYKTTSKVDNQPVSRQTANLARRVFVLDGDKAVVILDQIEPANPSDQITSYYQCGFIPTILPDGKSFRIPGKNSDMAVLLDGPQSTLSVEGPFKWKQEWVYAQLGVQWRRVHASPYTYAPDQPRVTIMLPLDQGAPVPAVSVQRAAGSISVTVPGAQPVTFKKEGNLWQTQKS